MESEAASQLTEPLQSTSHQPTKNEWQVDTELPEQVCAQKAAPSAECDPSSPTPHYRSRCTEPANVTVQSVPYTVRCCPICTCKCLDTFYTGPIQCLLALCLTSTFFWRLLQVRPGPPKASVPLGIAEVRSCTSWMSFLSPNQQCQKH